MRNYIKITLTVVFAAFIAFTAFSKEKERLKLAKQHKFGMYREVNVKKAFQIYSELAQTKSPEALVELGNMYLRGEGTEPDFIAARECFQDAVNLGYAPAMCRLALMYQKGAGDIQQDFLKAFELYDLAAKKDDAGGYYGAGYLMYKGFGAKQNYGKALTYFEKGAAKGDARCEYMLACHELLGYENSQNPEKAKKHLEKSMARGHSWIEDVIKHDMVDSLTRKYKRNPNRWSDIKNGRINHVKRTLANKSAAGQLSGEWQGKVYTYDWSGKKIENEENLKLIIEVEDNRLTLQWYINDSLHISCNAEKSGNEWIAPTGRQYNLPTASRWYVSHSRYDVETKGGKEILYADFQTYNMDLREPCMPQMAVLERIQSIPKSSKNRTLASDKP